MPELTNDGVTWSESGGNLTGRPNKIDDGTKSVTAAQARDHIDDTSNPHAVSAAQVSAIPESDRGVASGVATLGGDGVLTEAERPQGETVNPLGLAISDPPTQTQVKAVSDKVDELLASLRGAALIDTFAPTDIAGLQLWLDASDASTITESSGSVSQWDDKSGNGNHVSQGTAADQPTTGVRTINGLNVLDTDVGDYLTRDITNIPVPYTVFIVSQLDTTGSLAFVGISGVSVPGSGDSVAIGANSTNFYMFAGDALLSVPVDTSVHVLTGLVNGASSVLAVDGAETVGDAGTRPLSVITVPYHNIGANSAIAEVLVYDSALSTADREALEVYLAQKWGITLS